MRRDPSLAEDIIKYLDQPGKELMSCTSRATYCALTQRYMADMAARPRSPGEDYRPFRCSENTVRSMIRMLEAKGTLVGTKIKMPSGNTAVCWTVRHCFVARSAESRELCMRERGHEGKHGFVPTTEIALLPGPALKEGS